MIDVKGRQKLIAQRQNKETLGSVMQSFGSALTLQRLLDTVNEKEKVNEELLRKIGQALAMMYKKMPQEMIIPSVYPVKGAVSVTSLPPVSISNLEELAGVLEKQQELLSDIVKAIAALPKEFPAINIPKSTPSDNRDIVKALSRLEDRFLSIEPNQTLPSDHTILLAGFGRIESSISNLQNAITSMPQRTSGKAANITVPPLDIQPIIEAIDRIPGGQSNEDVVHALQRIEEGIAALYNRPQMTPQPATHMSINGLNGSMLTSQIQLGSTVTALPATPLANRRSLQLYNNGANTIYFGGSGVTTGNGIPVPSGAFSDIIDAGAGMVVYGISQSGQNNDIRVLEVSDIAMGT